MMIIVNLCQLPYSVCKLTFTLIIEYQIAVGYDLFRNTMHARNWLYTARYLNYALNAIVYMWRGQKYRNFFKELLRRDRGMRQEKIVLQNMRRI